MPLTLVQTPAGYGKSSLLSQWFQALRRGGHCACWLSVDRSDTEPAALLTYLAAALSNAGVRFDPTVDSIAAANVYSEPEPLLTSLVNSLEQHRESVSIFIDDVHLLEAAPLATLSRLIECSPEPIHYVLASRTVPALNLARPRARGKLIELAAADLRFTPDETQSFLRSSADCPWADSELATVEQRTEGWIVGIKLMRLAVRQGAAPSALLSSFNGSRRSVSDFFTEEVLLSQPEEVRDFLLRTSVLEQLCPALCDAVTGNGNGRQMLNFIESSGLFLLRLDDERYWYRYHHLFAECLRQRLREEDPGAEHELQLRASRWLWGNGFHLEAVRCALDGDAPREAADLLEQRCQDMTYNGQLRIVSRLAARIPSEFLHRCPRLLLSLAWLLMRSLRFEEAAHLLSIAKRLIDERESKGQADPAELRRLRHLLLHREMTLAAAHDDAPRVEQLCRQLVEELREESHPYIAGTIYAQLLYARREQYLLEDLDRLTATAEGILARSPYTFAAIGLQASIGPSLFFAGRSDAAQRLLEAGLAEAVRFVSLNSAMTALPALPLSEILYEANNLTRAEELIERTLPHATELCFVDQLMPGYLVKARLAHVHGDLAGALQCLDDGLSVAVERGLERLRLALVAERVRLLCQHGRLDEARHFARCAGIPGDIGELVPSRSITTCDELRALAWVRIALGDGRTQEALSLGKQWRRHVMSRGAVRSLVRWDLLLAQALCLQGDQRAAQRTLREAISKASSSRLVRSFVDEGPMIHTLLAGIYEGDLEVLHPSDAFAAEVLEIFARNGKGGGPVRQQTRESEPAVLLGRLTSKECEILGLVSSGLRNREVAQKLGMTEGSVKWYMQQVYDKIGTRRRLQAVERARQFGLIA